MKALNTLTIQIILSVFLLIYVGLKASFLSMTIDESSTFLSWASKPINEIIFNIPAHGNNHILNTLLMKGSVAIFGNSEFAVRLPNVLAFSLYLFFSVKISQLFNAKQYLPLLLFVALNFQPYKMDFFCFGRGYGLALAFMLGSIYALLRWIEMDKKKYSILAFGFAILAVYSNFVWLNYFVALGATFMLLIFIKKDPSAGFYQNFISKLFIPFFAAIFLFGLIYIPLRGLHDSGDLQIVGHWGNKGFWHDTYYSLFASGIYGIKFLGKYTVEIVMGLVSSIYFLGGIYVSVKILTGKKTPGLLIAFFILMIFILMAVSTVLQHALFGTGFLENRTALVFTPFLGLLLPVLLNIFPENLRWNNKYIYLLITVMLIIHSLNTFRLDYTRKWSQNKDTKAMILYVNEQIPEGKTTKLGVHWSFMPATNFYISTNRAPRVSSVKWDQEMRKDTFYDYYYIYKRDQLKINKNYQLVKSFGANQLYKRKNDD